jgi:hypothetical protein
MITNIKPSMMKKFQLPAPVWACKMIACVIANLSG